MPLSFADQPFTGRTPGQGERMLGDASLGSRYYIPDATAATRLGDYSLVRAFLQPDMHRDIQRHEEAQNLTGAGGGPSDTERFWIPVDFPGMLGRLMRHYTIGRDFRVEAKLRGTKSGEEEQRDAQSEVDRITESCHLPVLLRQCAESTTTFGDSVLRLDVQDKEDGDGVTVSTAVARFVKPFHYFPRLSRVDATTVEAVTLAWVFSVDGEQELVADGETTGLTAAVSEPEVKRATSDPVLTRLPGGMDTAGGASNATGAVGTDNLVVLREIHTPGDIKYKLNFWDGKRLGESLTVKSMFPDLEDRETGIDEIPIVHLGNAVRGGEHFGSSEVLRVQRIILALENRLSQEDEVLEKHARPKLIVGPGVLDPEGRANLADFDVIEIAPDIMEKAVKPEYLTWNMQIGAIQHEIEKLEEYLFMTTETSPSSFGLERDGSQVESGRALRFKAHRTVNKVNDQRDAFTVMLVDFYRIAQKLELAKRQDGGKGAGYTRANVVPQYGDPILEDQTQEVQDYVSRKSVGLVSTSRAVQDLDNLTDEQTDREVQSILQDEVNSAAAFGAAQTPPPAIGGEAAPPAGVPGPAEAAATAAATEEATTNSTEKFDEGEAITANTVMNGAQVQAVVGLVESVSKGTLEKQSAVELMKVAFGIEPDVAERIIGDPKPPAAPPPFGGGPPAAPPADDDDDDDE